MAAIIYSLHSANRNVQHRLYAVSQYHHNDDIVNKSESEMDPTTNNQSLTYKARNSEEMIDVENA